MSEKKNAVDAAKNETVMTKYDQKMQRRKVEAQKSKKDEIKGLIIGIVLVIALAAFVVSFPLRSNNAVKREFVKIGGEKVTRVEFDMHYKMSKEMFIAQVGYYLTAFGVTDFDALDQMDFVDNMTFGEYFEQLAAEKLVEQKALLKMAKKEGFAFDAAAALEEARLKLNDEALMQGKSLEDYVPNKYGTLATWERITPYMEDYLYASAYYNKLVEDCMPTDEEIQTEYEANKKEYDSVDFRLSVVEAVLPTTAPDGKVQKDEAGNEIAYEPTEEEIADAMKKAYAEAVEAEKTVFEDGDVYKDVRLKASSEHLDAFLWDESRKAGDTTIVELSDTNIYWIAGFEGRHVNEAPTYDVRMIYTLSVDPQMIVEEWKAGEATEATFAQYATMYDEGEMSLDGGYISGLNADSMPNEVKEWMTAEREAGDVFCVTLESGAGYVLYYIGENDPVWKLEIKDKLMTAELTVILEEAAEGIEIQDKKKNLEYLYVEE